ncbi:hypothetical protein C4D60_Mb06t18810 [Musa balbisiana]|uniref:VPS9 domain-containing protein n=1 Tax=Musa balbisiana TaxID=52838 RepID=A0A4S8IP37_MUSBA|nr:hypothetical protein C4D60_Mb06t18810 [Musa balbisiana]
MAVAIAADHSFRFRWNPHMSPTLISTIFSIGCADPLPPILSAPSKGFSHRFWNLTAGGGPWRWDRGFSRFWIFGSVCLMDLGLEKYIMTKLFTHTFASSSEDAKLDLEISEKICLLQHFIKPDHLDVPRVFQNEASWLFAAKELQKINFFKAPRDKLLCIMNCCRIINNLLLDISMTTNHTPAGADDFLPILIYVTIKASSLSTYFLPVLYILLSKSSWWVGVYCRITYTKKVYSAINANPPQLHSNLKFVQLYRKHSKLVSEVEYYLTNLISAKTFITNINASSLSIDESEFHRNMQLARLASEITVNEPSGTVQLSEGSPPIVRNKYIYVEGNRYPFMEAEARDLRLEDVQQLLGLYKQVVTKYRKLSEALRQLSIDENQLLNNHQRQDMKEKIEQQLEQAGNSGGTR